MRLPCSTSGIKIIKTIKFDKVYILTGDLKTLSYADAIPVTNKETYSLYITNLPLIHISMDINKINNRKKIVGDFSFYNINKCIDTKMGIRHRGNLSLSFSKKSFDIEFWKNSTSKQPKDVKLQNMRSDDDWILDAMFNEPLRLRSYLATHLWTKINTLYYKSKEPEAKSGFDVSYVEVFQNNEYCGLYQLSEPVDKKQLKLKSSTENDINGELFKAESYKGGPDFTKAAETYNDAFRYWNGWRTEYPFIDYRSNFKNLFWFQNLVVKESDAVFSEKIAESLDLNNAVDYYLFVNLIRATDNLGKNYYLGKYDENEPCFIIPWDLDGTFGVIQDGKQINTTTDILTNGLFDRLIKLNPNDYKSKVKLRWQSLRSNEFSDKNLMSKIDAIYSKFTTEKVYEREQLVWQNKLTKVTNEEHYNYLSDWLKNRLLFLDSHFEKL